MLIKKQMAILQNKTYRNGFLGNNWKIVREDPKIHG